MATEILPTRAQRIDNRFTMERPDFSDFDQPVLGWVVSMANSIDREDTLNITFARLPKYQGTRLAKGTDVEIPIGPDSLKLTIREITYTITANSSRTNLLLATKKIVLDNFISEGWKLSKERPTPSNVLSGLNDKLGMELEINASDLPWPTKKVAISGRQNVLDYMREVLSVESTPIYNWWIDAWGTFNLHRRDGKPVAKG